MTDVDGVLQLEVLDQLRQVVGVLVHVLALPRLARAAVAAAVMGDDAIAMRGQEKRLVLEGVGAGGQPWLKTMGCPVPQSLNQIEVLSFVIMVRMGLPSGKRRARGQGRGSFKTRIMVTADRRPRSVGRCEKL
jgi:hypothetical protein